MALSDDWKDIKEGTDRPDGDELSVEPINRIAHAVIDLEKNGTGGGGGTGTTDYEDLDNKPSINGVELSGNVEITIPTKTSDLENDSNFVSDKDYVHTDNNFTDEDKEKLDNIDTTIQRYVEETILGGAW